MRTMLRRKILQEIHPLNLIKEVEKWPVLYEKEKPEKVNLHLKYKMWLEVAKALFDDWDTYSESEQEVKVKQLMSKWRNLRDTFKRNVEKQIKKGKGANKKPYVYFKYMLFLLPHITPFEEPPEEPVPELDEYIARKRKRQRDVSKTEERQASTPVDITPLPTTFSNTEDTIDGDKHFLLSLIPTFKKMSEDEKLTVKMEILKVIREVKKSNKQEEKSTENRLPYVPEPTEPIKLEFFDVEAADESDSENSEITSD